MNNNSTEIVSVDEVLAVMLAILSAPGADVVERKLNTIEKMDLSPREAASKRAEINVKGVKWLGLTKNGWKAKEYDKAEIAAFIIRLSGINTSELTCDELKEKIKALINTKNTAEGFNGKD
ncbi:hypothetical protein EJN64_06380 [Salmonella enterica]|nr:hypothetical protein [Salmonella enterica]ECK7218735.1 hypothetical protein [Salmonella enterica subsp. enterica serovar Potsdam]ECY4822353.1 hypothetical protein [Salmonella enterica subsp. enterica serovar Lindern]EEC5248744.1 hypothetical protein [Salmonella enterica subsp. enterica]MJY36629.1 hypothetical protein [Salmonella enterica subsp. enterica serovar Abony]